MDFGENPFWVLLRAWPVHPDTSALKDIGINLVLYMPLGASGYLSAPKGWPKYLHFVGPVAFALLLSGSIEIAQLYDATRDASAADVVCNVAGAVAGVILTSLFLQLVALFHPKRSPAVRDWSAVLLLLCWLAYQGLAVVPSGRWRSGMQDLVPPMVLLGDTAALVVGWVVVGALADVLLGRRGARYLLAAMLAPLPARLLTGDPTAAGASIAAGLLGLFFWLALPVEVQEGRLALAAIACILLTIRGLSPFHLLEHPSSIDWVPFDALFGVERQAGLLLFLRKVFDYGAPIWLLWRSRIGVWTAGLTIAALLTALEITQRYLPGRVAEITDPLLALLLAWIFWSLRDFRLVHTA